MAFSEVLTAARGLGVGLVAAHQHLAQLSGEVRDAILANAGSRVVFSTQANDAVVLSKLAGAPAAEDFQGLGLYEIYTTLRSNGQATGWMSGRTLPALGSICDPDVVRAESRRRYGVDRTTTEAALREWIEPLTAAEGDALEFGIKRGAGGMGAGS